MSDDEDEHFEVFDMQAFLGLSDRDMRLMRTKWAMINDIGLMLEAAGIDEARLAEVAGEDPALVERCLRGMVRHVSLDTIAVLYDAAAELAHWPSLESVIRGPADD